MKVVRHALQHGRNALEPRTGIDTRLGQGYQGAVGLPVELHEHQVPDLQKSARLRTLHERLAGELRAVALRPLPRRAIREAEIAGQMREIDVQLRARPARSGVGHLPEVVRGAKAVNA